jgi:hypothetical protein
MTAAATVLSIKKETPYVHHTHTIDIPVGMIAAATVLSIKKDMLPPSTSSTT